MKQFLYLDTDIVNSIIAQSEKGLIQEQSEENGSDKKKGTHISGSMEGSGTAGGSFLKLANASNAADRFSCQSAAKRRA